MNLCLGTVQFGMDYGIRGGSRPRREDAVRMLEYAYDHGVDAVDTASAYGDAERVVGSWFKGNPAARDAVYLVSKFGIESFNGVKTADEYSQRLKKELAGTLRRTGRDYLDAYVCHVPAAVHNPRVLEAMLRIQGSGLVKRIGFSVYEVEDAQCCAEAGCCDFMQIPLSVLDQRMVSAGILEGASCGHMEVHSRSAFLQGLVFMNPRELPAYVSALAGRLAGFISLCDESGVSRRALAMAFVRRYGTISHLVFGVDNMEQLQENVLAFEQNVPETVVSRAVEIFAGVEPRLVMPNKWRI